MKRLYISIDYSTTEYITENGNIQTIDTKELSKVEELNTHILVSRHDDLKDRLQTHGRVYINHNNIWTMKRIFRAYNLNSTIDKVERQLNIKQEWHRSEPEKLKLIVDTIEQRFGRLPEVEEAINATHNKINTRGVKIDVKFVQQALEIRDTLVEELIDESYMITGKNKKLTQREYIAWLKTKGIETQTLNSDDADRIKAASDDEDVQRLMHIRNELSKVSLVKYDTYQETMNAGYIVTDALNIYGAQKTGRWSSTGIQLHNFPNHTQPALHLARGLIGRGDLEGLELAYPSVLEVLSELSSSAMIPHEHMDTFIIADYKNIESRVLAWITGEKWKTQAYRENKDIYEMSAQRIFNKQNITEDERQTGKIAELALGYGGGLGALQGFGLDKLSDTELLNIVTAWRQANPEIVSFWRRIEIATKETIWYQKTQTINGLKLDYKHGTFSIQLPSGRKLLYHNAKVVDGRIITYNNETDTVEKYYGGRLTENIAQAIARDILGQALVNIKDENITMHIHDEIVVEVPIEDTKSKTDKIKLEMIKPAGWAADIPLDVEFKHRTYYTK